MNKFLAGVSATAFCIAAATAANAQSASTSSQDANSASSPDDIIVTATRRDEKLNSIPIAVQAMSGESLQKLNVTNFDKMVEYLPNVRAANKGPGVSSIYIRGLSSDTSGIQIAGVAGVQPNVALYLNDMPASSPGRNLDIHATDMQRVEVLAGPQGTLFGASAMGGAIRYITNKPDLSEIHAGFSGSASTTRFGSGSYSAEGFVNIPVVKDKFAIRIAGYHDHQGGFIDNVATTYQMPWNPGGPGVLPTGNPLLVAQAVQSCAGVVNCVATASGTSAGYIAPTRKVSSNAAFAKDNFNDTEYTGGRIEATLQISDDWSIEALAMHQTLKSDGVFSYDPALGELKTGEFSNPTLKDTIDAATLTLKGRLGMLDMVLTSSFMNHRSVQTGDYVHYDNTGAYIAYYQCDRGVYYSGYANSYLQGNTCYAPTSTYLVDDKNKRFTQEFRITTPADKPLRATLGVFHDNNRLDDLTDWLYAEKAAGFIYDVAPNSAVNVLGIGKLPAPSAFVNTIRRTDKQFSVYGEASYDITPQLTITGGARYYSDTASLEGGSSSAFNVKPTSVRGICNPAPGTGTSAANPAVCNYVAAAVPPTELKASSNLTTALAGLSPHTYSGFIFKGNLNYKINDRSLIYATYSEGFRPGGFNRRGCAGNGVSKFGTAICDANKSYAPDKAYNYEIGAKLGLMDRQLQVNLAAYIINWKNVLMSTFDENISNQTFINNLGNARIHGIEGDVTIRPHGSGLTVNSGFSYNDSKFLGPTNNPIAQLLSSQGVLVPAGSPLALSPKFQGNLRIRYDWQMGNGLKPFVSAGMHYVGSSISSDVANTDILYGGCNGGFGAVSPYPACSTATNSPINSVTINGVVVNKGDPIALVPTSFTLPAYTTFEASFGFEKDGWSLTFFGDNLTDQRPQLFISANDGKRVTTSRPRTFGMRFSYKM